MSTTFCQTDSRPRWCATQTRGGKVPAAIEGAIADRLERTLKQKPDPELIAQIEFLKAVVVISSDGTNEPAYVTTARRESP